MIEVTVADVIERKQEDQRSYLIVLLDKAGRRILPIYIGASEGRSIAYHLLDRRAPRPLTYDFIANILKAIGTELEEVRVEALKKSIFYAVAKLRSGDTVQEVDARPSDAIALSLCTGSPIYVIEEVLEKAGIDIPEDVWKTRRLGSGLDDIMQEFERRWQEWERRRQESKSRPRPPKEEVEKGHQELINLVFGIEA